MLEPFDLSLKGSILCFTHFRTQNRFALLLEML